MVGFAEEPGEGGCVLGVEGCGDVDVEHLLHVDGCNFRGDFGLELQGSEYT